MPHPIVLAYYSNLATIPRGPELIFLIAIFKCCICALFSFLLSSLVGSPVVFSRVFTDVEDIAAWEYLFRYLRVDTTLYNLSGFSVSCQIAPSIL